MIGKSTIVGPLLNSINGLSTGLLNYKLGGPSKQRVNKPTFITGPRGLAMEILAITNPSFPNLPNTLGGSVFGPP